LLVFIGIGVEQSPSLRAIQELKTCDVIYFESYTSPVLDDRALLDTTSGQMGDKIIEKVKREFVEEGWKILQQAKTKKVALVSSGDPLVATTHQDLRTRAIHERIETRVVHASSILTAVGGEFGLHSYSFGRIVTMTEEPMQYTAYNTIYQNLLAGLHSTLLLQWDESRNFFLTPDRAIKNLESAEKDIKYGIIRPKTLFLTASRLGSDSPTLRASLIEELPEVKIGEPPLVMVIPGSLHFTEKEALGAIVGRDPNWFPDNTEAIQKLSRSMLDRYSSKTKGALQRARKAALALSSEKGEQKVRFDQVFENVECYLQDSLRFMNEGKEELAVLSIGYAEGLLDSLRFAGLVEFEW